MANSSKEIILKLAVDVKDSKKNLTSLNKTFDKTNTELKQVNRWTKATTGSIEKYQAANVILRKRLKNINQETEIGAKKAAAYRKVIDKNTEKIREYSDSMVKQKMRIGDYGSVLDAFKDKFPKLSGAISSVIKPLTLIGGSILFMVKGFQKLNKEITITNNEFLQTKTLLGSTSEEARLLQTEIRTLSDIYGVEFKEVLKATNTLMKEFGISSTGALNIVEEGFKKGANINGDYLETLKEYSSQMSKAGISANDFNAIITQSVKEGIFSDKGVDAIKEAALRLREMTPAASDALKAIGINAKELKDELNNGTITMFEAIQKVSKEMKSFGDDSTEVGTILADVFAGAGEDAGIRYVRMLGDMKTNMEDLKEETNDFNEASKDLTESWDTFSISLTQSDTLFGKIITKAKAWTAQMLDGLTVITRTLGTLSLEWKVQEDAIKESGRLYDEFITTMGDASVKSKTYREELISYQEKLIDLQYETKKNYDNLTLKERMIARSRIKAYEDLIKKVKEYNIQSTSVSGDVVETKKSGMPTWLNLTELGKKITYAIKTGLKEGFDKKNYDKYIGELDLSLKEMLGDKMPYKFNLPLDFDQRIQEMYKSTAEYYNLQQNRMMKQKDLEEQIRQIISDKTKGEQELLKLNEKYIKRWEAFKKTYPTDSDAEIAKKGSLIKMDYLKKEAELRKKYNIDYAADKVKKLVEVHEKEMKLLEKTTYNRFLNTKEYYKLTMDMVLKTKSREFKENESLATNEYDRRLREIKNQYAYEKVQIQLNYQYKQKYNRISELESKMTNKERKHEEDFLKRLRIEYEKEISIEKDKYTQQSIDKQKKSYQELQDWKNELLRQDNVTEMYMQNRFDDLVYENKKGKMIEWWGDRSENIKRLREERNQEMVEIYHDYDTKLITEEEFNEKSAKLYEDYADRIKKVNEKLWTSGYYDMLDRREEEELQSYEESRKYWEQNLKEKHDKKVYTDDQYYEKLKESERNFHLYSAELTKKYEKLKLKYKLDKIAEYAEMANNITQKLMDSMTNKQLQKLDDELYYFNRIKDDEINAATEANDAIQDSDEYTAAQKEYYAEQTKHKLQKLEDEKAAKDLQIRQRQAQYEKKIALMQLAMNTAVAVMKSAPNPYLIATTIAMGLAEAAVIDSQQIPKYADGGKIEGDGTGRSDSITAKVSNGEYVINAAATKQYEPILDSINSGDGSIKLDTNTINKLAQMINDKKVINVATETQSVNDNVVKIKNNAKLF